MAGERSNLREPCFYPKSFDIIKNHLEGSNIITMLFLEDDYRVYIHYAML